jgi:glycosyltransferase involved in cell wall biosynthesis
MRIAIIVSHPIQYYSPLFKLLAQKTTIKVFYTWGESSLTKYDPGFNKTITWDIDLLSGYDYEWAVNTATKRGSHHFNGIINPDLIDQVSNWQPHAILIFGWAYNSHFKVMRHFKGKLPILFRGDSMLLDKFNPIKKIARDLILRWVYRHIDHAFYVGTNNKAYFKKHGLREFQLTFAPHAIANERFEVNRQNEVSALKQKLKIDDENLLILFAGKFEPKKDPLLLITCFLQLQNPNVHLLMVGNGILEKELKAAAGKNAHIHFMDFVNQSYMPVIYQACDVFCLPSRGPLETWGLSVNEAMACGKALLVSDKAGCSADLIKEGINGYIHRAGSLKDFFSNLENLINTGKENLKIMGERSKEIIKPWNFVTQANNIINYKNAPGQ